MILPRRKRGTGVPHPRLRTEPALILSLFNPGAQTAAAFAV